MFPGRNAPLWFLVLHTPFLFIFFVTCRNGANLKKKIKCKSRLRSNSMCHVCSSFLASAEPFICLLHLNIYSSLFRVSTYDYVTMFSEEHYTSWAILVSCLCLNAFNGYVQIFPMSVLITKIFLCLRFP